MYDESNRGDTMNKILIVEDEQAICRLIKINLSDAGYSCKCAYDGKGAIELIEYIRPLEIPVIFLTAKGDVKDRVKGLKLGAEDYIVKPFEIIELVARVETVLRRYHKTSTVLSVYDISVDTLSRVVKKNDQVINLTVKEYDLLLLFIQNKNIALFRDRIYEAVWGDYYMGDSRTVDLHVQRMRKKLGLEDKIVPVYKVGYRLEGD